MDNFMRSKEYWGLVENGIPASVKGMTDAQHKSVSHRPILVTILKKSSSKDIWDSMKQKFESNTRVKRAQLQFLRKEFETFHMKASETMNEYFSRILTIDNKLKESGGDKGDIRVVEGVV
ncbi:hypothetical protein KY290_026099 [Solanum tuberosum]|uniref:Retrovirus-related Pol polyprotein from transposon TNT 1-94 n=1 Tax=Solanum tuberosum TaxID=4113 RepID=A0ABQ7UX50_SOLTU|nr:hypothetical protein KY284_024968 [Solanum tuberosum]KAH0755829.1 hypothetical protein KY290_026099 [Solanum tuberosum]